MKSLSRGQSLAKSAATLLMELLKDGHARDTLEQLKHSFLILVTTYLQERDVEVIQTMGHILDQLSDKRENVVKMAEANWCQPLIKQLCEGELQHVLPSNFHCFAKYFIDWMLSIQVV